MASVKRVARGFVRVTSIVAGIALLLFLHSTGYLDTLGARPSGARRQRMEASPHFRDGEFKNLAETAVMAPGKTFAAAKDFFFARGRRTPEQPLPAVAVSRATFEAPPADDVRVTWLGHSTVLVEIEGERVLFDPVWAQRSSPSQAVGPKRFQPVPLPLDQVPPLSAVAVSHDHYDHLDPGAIRALAAAQPAVPFFVPLGVGAHLEKWGVPPGRIHEHDWWEEEPIAEGRLRLACVPARHFSGRGVFDRDLTQWASWALVGAGRRVYFGGDSGQDSAFAEIARRYGPFDLTMLEIGAFHPNWGLIHLGPEGALATHRQLQGRLLLPIHWGTFDLGLHPWDEPVEALLAAAPAAGAALLLPRLGEAVRLAAPPPPQAWWRAGPKAKQ